MSDVSEVSHGHSHGGKLDTKATGKTRMLLAAFMVPLIIATAIGAALLWPDPNAKIGSTDSLGVPTDAVKGLITSVQNADCQAQTPDAGKCQTVVVRLQSGPESGQDTTLVLPQGPGQYVLEANEGIILGRADVGGAVTYYFSDLERSNGLAILGVAFAVMVVLVARWRGVGAILGLGITYAVITKFLLPSILDGNSPVFVTLVGSAAIVLVVLYVAHGFNVRTTTAIIGTLVSLILVGLLAVVGVDLANVTGLSSEEVTFVQSIAGNVSVQGLLLGGIILGGLGVLNDMTVSQASSVWEIHRASPNQSRRELYRGGMRVGRDHIASTVYTLVLAYTGASLPLLILFTLSDRSLSTVLTTDVVGEEIVRTVVGAIGLMASVPITTALAAIVVKGQRLKHDAVAVDDAAHVPALSAGAAVEPVTPESGADSTGDLDAAELYGIEPPAEPTEAPPAKERRKEERRKTDRRRGLLGRRRDTTFNAERKMSRRERRFWEED